MSLQVSAGSKEDLDKAVAMANDLISAVLEEYDKWLTDGGAEGSGKGKGKRDKGGRDKGGKGDDNRGGKGDYRKVIKLKETEGSFQR